MKKAKQNVGTVVLFSDYCYNVEIDSNRKGVN